MPADPRKCLAVAVGLALAVAGCSGDAAWLPKTDWLPKADFTFSRPDWNLLTKEDARARVIRPDDLIGADGRCAGDPMPAATPGPQVLNFTAGPQVPGSEAPPSPDPAAAPAVPVRRGVGLGMTECDVVRAIGYTDRMEISTNERGQRSIVLTYPAGERPGIYRFVAGQLVAIERTGEPPPAPKPPAKTKKIAKKQTPS